MQHSEFGRRYVSFWNEITNSSIGGVACWHENLNSLCSKEFWRKDVVCEIETHLHTTTTHGWILPKSLSSYFSTFQSRYNTHYFLSFFLRIFNLTLTNKDKGKYMCIQVFFSLIIPIILSTWFLTHNRTIFFRQLKFYTDLSFFLEVISSIPLIKTRQLPSIRSKFNAMKDFRRHTANIPL